MSDQTQGGIAWTDETWNPVRGCSREMKHALERAIAPFDEEDMPF